MKNAKRIVISAAFLLVAVGGLMTAAAAAMGNFGIKDMKGLSYEMKTFEVKEAFSDICVEDAECNVRILRATDGNCKVICPEKQDGSIYHTVTVSDGVLNVQRHDERKWYQYIGVSFGIPDVKVYLPEKEYGKLSARSTAGGIQVEDGFTFESASLESISGRIRMHSEVKKELKAEATSGSVKGTLLSNKIFLTDSSSGSVKVPRSSVGGECEITTTSGSIAMEIKQ